MIGFLLFSIKRAVQGFWRNAVMSVAATVTMVLMLLLLAGLVIVLSGLQAGLRYIEAKVEVQALLNDGVSRERVAALESELVTLPEVSSVEYTSKEDALREFREQLTAEGREDLTVVAGTNPLPASLAVKLTDPHEFGRVIETLQEPPGVVREVIEKEQNIDKLLQVTGVLRTIGLIVLTVVGATVLLIVVNTIRMAVMARANEIEIMRLVGASDAFIRWPFIFEGLLVGLAGAIVTLGLLSLASAPLGALASSIAGQLPAGFSRDVARQVVALVLAAGLGLGGLGAIISVRTYLRR